jgi:hypothetical protein
MNPSRSRFAAATLMTLWVVAAAGQSAPPVAGPPPSNAGDPAPAATKSHGIEDVDPAPLGGSIAVPLPQQRQRMLKKYDMPELAGARQAIGSQLINGELPRPLADYIVREDRIEQRLSLFEGGLTVINMSGGGGTIRKKVIIPEDALASYLKPLHSEAFRETVPTPPRGGRRAVLRVYAEGSAPVEITFDPMGTLPKTLRDAVGPIEDLLRAMSEDRAVTSSVAGYEPKVGDQLVGDDRRTYRVERIIPDGNIVVLHCTSQPTILYVAKKDLYNYFVGSRASEQ